MNKQLSFLTGQNNRYFYPEWKTGRREKKAVIFSDISDFVSPGASEEHLKCAENKTKRSLSLSLCCENIHITHQTNATAQSRVCISCACVGVSKASVLPLAAPGLEIIPRLLQNTLQNFCLLSKLITLVGQIKQGALNGTQTWREWSAWGRRVCVCVCVCVCVPETVCLCVN